MACNYFLEEALLKCFDVESTKATIGSETKPHACANTIVTPEENSSSICQESSQYDANPPCCQLITNTQTIVCININNSNFFFFLFFSSK
jgi:hypothetical protein